MLSGTGSDSTLGVRAIKGDGGMVMAHDFGTRPRPAAAPAPKVEYALKEIFSVTSIGGGAFQGVTGLTTVNIPLGVTSIGSGAFQNDSGLTDVYVNATTPPSLGATAFASQLLWIHVPSGTESTYQAATGWSAYALKIVYP